MSSSPKEEPSCTSTNTRGSDPVLWMRCAVPTGTSTALPAATVRSTPSSVTTATSRITSSMASISDFVRRVLLIMINKAQLAQGPGAAAAGDDAVVEHHLRAVRASAQVGERVELVHGGRAHRTRREQPDDYGARLELLDERLELPDLHERQRPVARVDRDAAELAPLVEPDHEHAFDVVTIGGERLHEQNRVERHRAPPRSRE